MSSSPESEPKAATAPKRPRRSQAERSADMRARLIEAAIVCLYETGYAATTTAMVAARAGVSRGAMTHQFPNKIDLMEAVVATVYEDELEEYDRLINAQPSREVFSRFPRLTWAVLSRPSAMAVTEIMMGSRSDAAMAERLGARQRQIEINAAERLADYRLRAGAPSQGPHESRVAQRLVVAAVRGLAIEALFTPDRREIEEAIDLLSDALNLVNKRT